VAQKVVPWVLIRLDRSVLGIESSAVREMLLLPRTTPIPTAGADIRGVITLRDRAIPVVDLRTLLGMPSLGEAAAALNALLVQRAEDHRRWVMELEASVREDRPFTLTLDPHQCAFGKWYDTFTATSVVLESHMKRFDRPHKEIHALGRTVGDLVKEGHTEDAHELVARARQTTLATLIQLFDDTPRILAEMNREMVIVLRDDHALISVTADAVQSVEAIKPETLQELQLTDGVCGSGFITHTARTAKADELILILDAARLLSEFSTILAHHAAPASVPAAAA